MTYAAVLVAGYGCIAVIYYLSICHPAVNRQCQGSWSRHTHTLAAYGELYRLHHDPLGWSRLLATSVESLSACNIIPEWSLPSRSRWSGACGGVERRLVQMRCRWCSTSCCQVKQAAMAKCGQSVFSRQRFSHTFYQISSEHRADIPIPPNTILFKIFDYRLHLVMTLPFVRALSRKVAEILRFFPITFMGLFHEIGIAKVLLTPKPCTWCGNISRVWVTVGRRY